MPRSASGNLFVANTAPDSLGSISVFTPGSPTLVATLTRGVNEPASMAVDSAGNLYVANSGSASGSGSITVLSRSGSVRRVIRKGLHGVGQIAIDSGDTLYVVTGQGVNVYPKGGSTPSLAITGIASPSALAVDRQGNAYVGSYTPSGSSVIAYAPGSNTPSYTIPTYKQTPTSFAFDSAGNLYVASYYSNPGQPSPPMSSVQIFSPGSTTPLRAIVDRVALPRAIAIDGSDTLYVANLGFQFSGATVPSSVTEYASGQTSPALIISTGIFSPIALAVDASRKLYVLNSGARKGLGTVTVYDPGSSTPSLKIKHVSRPTTMILAP